LQYFLATKILDFYLGIKWVNEVIFPFDTPSNHTAPMKRAFRTSLGQEKEDRMYHQQKVQWLAELLFNLAAVPNFDHKLDGHKQLPRALDTGGQRAVVEFNASCAARQQAQNDMREAVREELGRDRLLNDDLRLRR
jgi:hypothetical protein